MNPGLLDTLVKLASLGASGVCVLAIFWVGWLISKLPRDASSQQHRTMRLFMGMTIVIAVISFASGIANAWFNANEIAKVEQDKATVVAELKNTTTAFENFRDEAQAKIAKYEAGEIRNREVVASLAEVVDEKELATREQGASPELKSHIRILRKNIERLKGAESPDAIASPE